MTTTATPGTQLPIVGFVGHSGVGKTTLLERLIPPLTGRGLAVGVVKHASHGFLADRPGKDSYRLYESGANAVALISHQQVATFIRTEPAAETDVSLADALAGLPRDLDLVLAEGFSWEPIPRVVLFRQHEEPAPEHIERGEVIERVCVPSAPPGKPPLFSETLIDSLVRLVVARIAEMDEPSGIHRSLKRPAAALCRYRRSPQ
jgi:molybdopterin-guanine dinucleotide biosynthesis protein MobB